MPPLAVIDGIEIGIHWRERKVPHFHAYFQGRKYSFSIESLEQLANDQRSAPDQLYRKVRRWAKPRQGQLRRAWQDIQNHIDPHIRWNVPVEPTIDTEDND